MQTKIQTPYSTKLVNVKENVLKATGLSEYEWFWMQVDTGRAFAQAFANTTDDPDDTYVRLMSKKPGQKEGERNFFWSWWVVQWLLDDRMYYRNKAQFQQISYAQFKAYMLSNEMLEKMLFEDLETIEFFNKKNIIT